jgi:hypothetical protein
MRYIIMTYNNTAGAPAQHLHLAHAPPRRVAPRRQHHLRRSRLGPLPQGEALKYICIYIYIVCMHLCMYVCHAATIARVLYLVRVALISACVSHS